MNSAMMHLANYPMLSPPADPQARGLLARASTPPILFGSPHDNALLAKARFEYKLRKLYHTKGLVTKAEVLDARLRWIAIENEYAAEALPPTPQTTIDTVRRLCQEVADEHDHIQSVQNDLNAVQCLLDRANKALNDPNLPIKNEEQWRQVEGWINNAP